MIQSNAQMLLFVAICIGATLFFIGAVLLVQKRRILDNQTETIESALQSSSIEDLIANIEKETAIVDTKLSEGQAVHETLLSKLRVIGPKQEMIAVGIAPAAFGIHDDENLKNEVRASQQNQLDLITRGNAINALSNWTFFGSESDGRKMVASYGKLLIRAFNSEFDLIRTKMRHNTFDGADEKLDKLADTLERLAESVGVTITREYKNEKRNELRAWHRSLMRLQKEKEERKAQREILLAQRMEAGSDDDDEVEDELSACEADLKKAKEMALKISGDELARLELEIQHIERQKQALEEKLSRSMSQAQITKAGYIYVISNVGSFGEGVVKIGMTRRLEPMDRVFELGDASVPFRFDIHTLAFVENAPAVEKALHNKFDARRVNKENNRKEFFRASPQEVKAAMAEMNISSPWYFECDAKEYRESLLILEAESMRGEEHRLDSDQLPSSI